MSVSDERDGEPMPGDTVIELRNGRSVIYTEPDRTFHPGWKRAGQIRLGSPVTESGGVLTGCPVFPLVTRKPGLYRFTIMGGPKDAVYIGQAKTSLASRHRLYHTRGHKPILPLKNRNTSTRIAQRMLRDRKYSEIVWLPMGRIASTSTNVDAFTGLPNTYP